MWSYIAFVLLYIGICDAFLTSGPQFGLSRSSLRASEVDLSEVRSVTLENDLSVDQCDMASEGTVDCQPRRAYVKPKPTVWSVFGGLAASTGASNLGQGKLTTEEQE